MQQKNVHIKNIDQRLKQWSDELTEVGFIKDDTELLKQIKLMDEKQHGVTLSRLLTIAALSRIRKTGDKDALVIAWLEKAKRLDPSNNKAFEFLAQYEWKRQQGLLDILIFPTIRETDNRPAKKKIADQIIENCNKFLSDSEVGLEELENGYRTAKTFKNEALLSVYDGLISLLVKVMEETGGVLKSAKEYEQSISGVFYTSTHYHDMRKHIESIEHLKKEWEQYFREEEGQKDSKTSLEVLDEMIGLEKVKERVNDFYQFLKYQKERKELGLQTKDALSLHMILTGNPGTGKTTLARLLAKVYYELGVLPREEVIEADRSQLVGAFVGQTEENVRAVVEKALGGVLFIDEAYSLRREGQTGNDYGQAAVDTLVSLMTGSEYGGKFAVILAGYPEEMRQFLDVNPGLRSRFPTSNYIHLDDYSNRELVLIGERLAKDNDYILTDGAKTELEKRLEKERVDETFGNARSVRNIVLDAIFKKGASKKETENILEYTILDETDFLQKEKKVKVPPSERLESLIGLDSVKTEVKTLVSFVKMQQIRREQGLPVLPLQLHSVFTGNPGTGKTTVAKIYAELLKECGILKRGHLIVTSRADFVAGYVGQTAIKTKKKIQEALGGVLFIDEAYSLLSQTSGDFGKEVIDTLVDEMTKRNENLVVILAGYPNEMETLLESNPGLKSRFKKFFQFQDYSVDELIEIMQSYASTYKYTLTNEARVFLKGVLSQIDRKGNGRFATNLMDEAIQSQSLRLLELDKEDLINQVSYITELDVGKAITKMRKGE
ncbi:AAA family ATPase [Cytobacillus sp. FJAT-54145]|uniref:AAA family ATPase n=1 Tax=Cytobacillus spartinae TaxID=3299023 RepID=A0ABW6K6G4_9BACI